MRKILNSILDLTRSQCSEANTGEMWSLFLVLVGTRAAAFWTSCRVFDDVLCSCLKRAPVCTGVVALLSDCQLFFIVKLPPAQVVLSAVSPSTYFLRGFYIHSSFMDAVLPNFYNFFPSYKVILIILTQHAVQTTICRHLQLILFLRICASAHHVCKTNTHVV